MFGGVQSFLGGDFFLRVGKISAPTLAVYSFFVISGYLVTPGLMRGGTLNYFIRRLSRIYPAWIAINFLIAFGFSIIWQHLSPSEIFEFRTPFIYFLTCLVPPPGIFHQGVTGINFLGGLPLGLSHSGAINGSAWSLALEVFCYVALGGLSILTFNHKSSFVRSIMILTLVLWVFALVISSPISFTLSEDLQIYSSVSSKWPYLLSFLFGVLMSFSQLIE